MDRRQVLATFGVGIGGLSGCLRLTGADSGATSTGEADASTDGQSTGGDGGASEGEPAGDVTLTENWSADPGIDFAWVENGRIYFSDYNGAASASHGSGINWEAEVTYEGFEDNFGADAFAIGDDHVTFGYRPDTEVDETLGSHFHTFDTGTGEEVWSFAAPDDGKHNFSTGATRVADTVVVTAGSFGAPREQEPLVVGLDAESGEVRWRTDKSTLPTTFVNFVGSYAGEVYVGMQSDGVQVLDPETGSLTEVHESWSVARGWGRTWGQIHGDTLFAADRGTSENETVLHAYPLGSNGREWSGSFEGNVTVGPVVDNSLVIVGTEAGTVYVFDRSTGETLWEERIEGSVGAVDASAAHVWVGDMETGITAYDRADGTRVHRSTKPLGGDDIAVSDDVLLLGGSDVHAYWIE